MFKVAKMQMQVLFHRKSTVVMYFLMFFLILCNFYYNVYEFYGFESTGVVNPLKLLFLADASPLMLDRLFLQFYPFLVIIPSAFAFFADRKSRELLYIQSRSNRRDYYCGTILAVFVVTFVVFVIPMLCEVALNCIALPLTEGDPSHAGPFDATLIDRVSRYGFSKLWIASPVLYAIFRLILFGCVSAGLACLVAALSMFPIFTFRILMFIPVYVLLQLVMGIEKVMGLSVSTKYYDYIWLYQVDISEIGYIAFIVCLYAVVFALLVIRTKIDELL